jgi:hypothetical protein
MFKGQLDASELVDAYGIYWLPPVCKVDKRTRNAKELDVGYSVCLTAFNFVRVHSTDYSLSQFLFAEAHG